MGMNHPESAEEFIAKKEKSFKEGTTKRFKKITRDGHHKWIVLAQTFMQQSSHPEKVLVFERLQRASSINSGKEDIQYRISYFIVGKNGNKDGKWVFGQFCPMIPQEDFEPLLEKARREGTLL